MTKKRKTLKNLNNITKVGRFSTTRAFCSTTTPTVTIRAEQTLQAPTQPWCRLLLLLPKAHNGIFAPPDHPKRWRSRNEVEYEEEEEEKLPPESRSFFTSWNRISINPSIKTGTMLLTRSLKIAVILHSRRSWKVYFPRAGQIESIFFSFFSSSFYYFSVFLEA